jgi:gliding motility-associated protein GldM
MAHGKETPRQKMIGMMYLVLTAMLALNVSKDVLNAFSLVDDGLSKTTENFSAKNSIIYDAFEKAYVINPGKVGAWKTKADLVKKKAEEIVNLIQDLKIKIIKVSDGDDAPSIKGKHIIVDKILNKDNNNVPAQIMVGDNNNGEANKLKAAIEGYREYLISLIDKKDVDVIESIKKSLDTSNPPSVEGEKKTWQTEHFEHLPLIAVITLMSKMQGDIRNAESDIIRYLYSQIDVGSFKFNKLEATIIPNSDYILKGNEYNAQVFIAASDTTQNPVVFVGKSATCYDSTKLPDGTYDYKMRGSRGIDYDSIPVINGKGIFKRVGGALGPQKWGGIIRLKKPDGSFLTRSFKQGYQVAEANLVVSPIKMNVFYTGVDNPVDISIPGIPADKIYPTISNGAIHKSGKSYIVNVSKVGTAVVSVSAEIEGKKRPMGSMQFRIKSVPDPVAKVGGLKGGSIKKNVLIAQNAVVAEMEGFDFDLEFKVVSFTVTTAGKGGFTKDETSYTNRFTEGQKNIFQGANRGQKIFIDDIKVVGPDGSPRRLNSISFKLE